MWSLDFLNKETFPQILRKQTHFSKYKSLRITNFNQNPFFANRYLFKKYPTDIRFLWADGFYLKNTVNWKDSEKFITFQVFWDFDVKQWKKKLASDLKMSLWMIMETKQKTGYTVANWKTSPFRMEMKCNVRGIRQSFLLKER